MEISNRALSEFIGEIYEASISSCWDNVLEKLMEYTDSNKAFFFLKENNSDKPILLEFKANFEYPAHCLVEYQSNPFDDPFFQVTKGLTEGEVVNCNDFLDINAYKSSNFYQKILSPMKSHYVFGGVLCRDGLYESAYSINRGPEQHPYSSIEYEFFRTITPHFSRAMHIYRELRMHKNYSSLSKSIIDQENKAILLLKNDCSVLLCNNYAEQHLNASTGIFFRGGKLEANNRKVQNKLRSYIEQCSALSFSDIAIQESIYLTNLCDNEEVLITVSPINGSNAFVDVGQNCCLGTIKFQSSINWETISSQFDLTTRELQLLQEICKKKKLNELSEVLFISYNTLRTHLQSIFQKFNVNSQTELMIKLNLFR